MSIGLLLLGGLVILLAIGVGLFISVMVMGVQIEKLKRKVEQLEQWPVGFYPASHQYLSDVNEWITKRGR